MNVDALLLILTMPYAEQRCLPRGNVRESQWHDKVEGEWIEQAVYCYGLYTLGTERRM